MCSRYALVSKIRDIEKRFGVTAMSSPRFEPNANIGPGKYAPVIVAEKDIEIRLMRFGLIPSWMKKPMTLINARAEGDNNPDDTEGFTGKFGIFEKPSFRKPVRSQRCIVPADAFYEGPNDIGLSKPYSFSLPEADSPFGMAGIWDEWIDENNKSTFSFAVITMPANALLRAIGHTRSPLVLDRNDEECWLDTSAPIHTIAALMRTPPASSMQAYPVSPRIKNPAARESQLLQPTGNAVDPRDHSPGQRGQLDLFG